MPGDFVSFNWGDCLVLGIGYSSMTGEASEYNTLYLSCGPYSAENERRSMVRALAPEFIRVVPPMAHSDYNNVAGAYARKAIQPKDKK